MDDEIKKQKILDICRLVDCIPVFSGKYARNYNAERLTGGEIVSQFNMKMTNKVV